MYRTIANVGLVMVLSAGAAVAAPGLSKMQAGVVTKQIATLKHAEERQMAKGWTDAKKVAEFICRPQAQQTLEKQVKGTDRVFLGSDDPASLTLEGNTQLHGSGQLRAANNWQDFRFECRLDPVSGKATSFVATMTP
jgi:hypothetical protein